MDTYADHRRPDSLDKKNSLPTYHPLRNQRACTQVYQPSPDILMPLKINSIIIKVGLTFIYTADSHATKTTMK